MALIKNLDKNKIISFYVTDNHLQLRFFDQIAALQENFPEDHTFNLLVRITMNFWRFLLFLLAEMVAGFRGSFNWYSQG